MMRSFLFAALLVLICSPLAAQVPPGIFFANIKDGDTLTSPFKLQVGLNSMNIYIDKANTVVTPKGAGMPGYFHLLVDAPLNPGAIPKDNRHLPFNGIEGTVQMHPGRHTLQIVMTDNNDAPYNPPIMTPVITVTVK